MSNNAVSGGPTARLLLELATEHASCEITIGRRTLILVEGRVVDVRGADDDRSLAAFLAAAGRIDERQRQHVEERVRDVGLTVDQALAELHAVDAEVLHETRRALLLDRLERALVDAQQSTDAPTPAPLRSAVRGRSFDLRELVNEAVARLSRAPNEEPLTGGSSPLGVVPIESWLTTARGTLSDPLQPLEAKIAELDAANAPAEERAAAWLALSDAFRSELHATAEATRAAREAAAAAPENTQALRRASELTSASGAPAIAYAYARAWATAASERDERVLAWSHAADCARRAGRPDEQRLALRAAVEVLPDDARLEEQLARALARNQERTVAFEHARKAAEGLRSVHPERARILQSWTAELVPNNLRGWNDLAKMLVRLGRSPIAVATLAHAARLQTDGALRERLRLSAVAFAELATQRESAIELLFEALDAGSALSEPLLAHLHAVSAWPEIAVLAEQLASKAQGSERAALLVEAAEARAQMHGGGQLAVELMTQAMCADPESTPIYDAFAALTVEHDDPRALIEGLERALKTWDVDGTYDEATRAKVRVVLTRIRELPTESTTAPLTQLAEERWARLTSASLDADTVRRLGEYRERFELLAQRLEHDLRAAEPHDRTLPALRLASLLRQDPSRRVAARKLYEKVLDREPANADAQSGLASLLRLEGDHATLDALAARRTTDEGTPESWLELSRRQQRAAHFEEALTSAERAWAGFEAVDGEVVDKAQLEFGHELLVLRWRLSLSAHDLGRAADALTALAERAPTADRRANLRMRLARLLTAKGEHDAANAHVEAALAEGSADAAVTLHHDMVQNGRAPKYAVLRALRETLGETPELLKQIARAAFAEHDAQAQREALESLTVIAPDDGFAARSLVALQATGRDADAIEAALHHALDPQCFGKQTPVVAIPALDRLCALRGAETAVRLVLTHLDRLGEQAQPLVAWAYELLSAPAHAKPDGVAELGAPAVRAELLEQWIAFADPNERPTLLHDLAALRREQGMPWAAARAELRLLSLVPNDTDAVERLASLYAETGETARLEAALDLLVERAKSEEERAVRLCDRAVVAAQRGERENAVALVERAFEPVQRDGREPTLESVRRAAGLLYAADPEAAYTLLLRLAPGAAPERTRTLIGEAIFLAEHRLGRPDLALEAAKQGALRQPQHPAFAIALERFARKVGDFELLVSALEESAERCDVLSRQAELLVRAASIAETELEDGVRASLLLDRAYRATPTRAVEDALLACANRLFTRDVRAGKLAYDRLRDTLHVRAKFGAAIARVHALITLGRLSLDVYLSRDEAAGYADAARTALAAEPESLEREQAQLQLEALTARLVAAGAPMRASVTRSSDKVRKSLPTELDTPLAGFTHSAPTFRPTSGSLAPQTAVVPLPRIVTIEPQAPLTTAFAFTLRPQGSVRPASAEDTNEAAPTRSEPARSPESLIAAVCAGDSAALRQLAELLQREPERAPNVCTELLARTREGSISVSSLRALRIASSAAHEHALWRTSSQALAFVEPPLRPPPSTRRRDMRSAQWNAALLAARASEHAAALTLLGQLVEAAAPLLRRPLSTVQGLPKDPEALEEAPYGPLLNDLSQTFGVRHDAYLAKNGEDRVSLSSVLPANIIVGDRTAPDTSSLRFRLARAFEAARPENAVLLTLHENAARTMLHAVSAAFADSAPAQVSREAAALAADLWRTMPSKAQRTLAAALKALPAPLSYDELVQAAHVRSARVALFVTRELDVALAQLGLDGDPRDPRDARVERTEGALDRALRDNQLVRALVAYAFSEAYLNAVVDHG